MALTCEHCCTRIEKLGVTFGDTVILENIDLHLNCGEVIAIVGPNGAGKTTLLRAILGEVPCTGKMSFRVSGRAGHKPRFGYVPQKLSFDSDSPVSVLDFAASSLSRRPIWLGVGKALRNKAEESLSLFSAGHLLRRRIGELSGGELQRILLAIAMTPAPHFLLLDEPNTGIDAQGLSLFYDLVRGLRNRHDISIIIVTHDLAGIAPYASRIVLLNRSVIAEGTPEDVLANKKTVEDFGLSLWNISELLKKDPGAKKGN